LEEAERLKANEAREKALAYDKSRAEGAAIRAKKKKE
jgi:hypothetical protein